MCNNQCFSRVKFSEAASDGCGTVTNNRAEFSAVLPVIFSSIRLTSCSVARNVLTVLAASKIATASHHSGPCAEGRSVTDPMSTYLANVTNSIVQPFSSACKPGTSRHKSAKANGTRCYSTAGIVL